MSNQFENLLHEVYVHGERRTDRTFTGTRSLFAPDPLHFNLREGRIPLITSKRVPWKMATAEFLWMLSGSTDVNKLAETSPTMAGIWSAWANDEGDIGPTYGAQYRNSGGSLYDNGFRGVDQLTMVVRRLIETPDTRRAVISLWSPVELADMNIEPCMVLFQFSLRGEHHNKLRLHVYQRSADMMLGVPFDLYQAGLLAHLVAREVTLATGKQVAAEWLTWSAGDVHIYENQLEAAEQQIGQWAGAEPMRAKISIDPFPSLRLLDGTIEPGHISISDYNPMPAIDAGKPAA